jgi:hypothetical protein
MKTKEIRFDDGTEIKMRSASADDYYEIMNSDGKLAEKSKRLIYSSIESWNFKDKDGNAVAKSIANFGKYVTVDYLKELNAGVEEVNNLNETEKKTS